MYRSILALLTLTLSLVAAPAPGEETTGTLLVTTDVPAAKCGVDGGPSGDAPFVARLAPRVWTVTCSTTVEGVVVKRTTQIGVVAGKASKLDLALKGAG